MTAREDLERVMPFVESMAIEATTAVRAIESEYPDAAPEEAFVALFKTAFDLGVDVGRSDIGDRVAAALDEENPEPMTAGVDEFRRALG